VVVAVATAVEAAEDAAEADDADKGIVNEGKLR
jgi:hypothetical protein